MKKLKYIALILIITACEKQLPLPLEQREKKLVINSFAEPDKPLNLYVSENTEILGEPKLRGDIYSGRLIVLENGQLLLDQSMIIDSGWLKTNILPVSGKEYSILLSVEGYPIISASDIVPDVFPLITTESIIMTGQNYHLRCELQDMNGAQNYLLNVSLVGKQAVDGDSIQVEKMLNFSSPDKLFLSNINTVMNSVNFALFNDKLLNGASRSLQLNFKRDDVFNDATFSPEYVKVSLSVLSDNYFDYCLSVLENNHIYGGPLATASFDGGNISGGLGIFGCYTAYADSLKFQ